MANNNRLELVIEVDVNRGNASIKTMNSTLSSLEQTATRVGRGASSGIDAITVSMAKGAAAGNVFADAIERGLGLAKEWTLGAVQTAAGVDQMRTSLHALAGSHNVSQEQTQRSIKTLKDLGFSTKEALLFTERMIIANIGLEKATRLATLARNAMATKFGTGGSPEEALEKIVMSIESGSSRGLRPYGLWVQFSKAQEIQAKLTGHALSEEEIQAIRLNDVFRAGHKIAGEYASIANGTAEKERLLKRDTEDLRIAFGEQLQNEFRKVIGYLSDLVGWGTKNSTWLPKVTVGVIGLTTALVALNAVVNMGALQKLGWLLMLPGLAKLASALPTVIAAIRTGMTGALVGLEVPLAAVVTAVGAVASGFGVWWGGKWLLEHAQGNKRLETTCNHLQT